MILQIRGLEREVELKRGEVSCLGIENPSLYARVAASLVSGLGENATEPYTIWTDEDSLVNPTQALFVIATPLELPITHRLLMGKILDKLDTLICDDDDMRLHIAELDRQMRQVVSRAGLTLNSGYVLDVEWAVKRYLKAFGFTMMEHENDMLLDKLIRFLALAKDASIKQTLVFIGLKNFLSGDELDVFCEQVFILNLSVLLLDNCGVLQNEPKAVNYAIDQHFIEI